MKWLLVLAATVLGAYHFWWQLDCNCKCFKAHQIPLKIKAELLILNTHIFKPRHSVIVRVMMSLTTWCPDGCLKKLNRGGKEQIQYVSTFSDSSNMDPIITHVDLTYVYRTSSVSHCLVVDGFNTFNVEKLTQKISYLVTVGMNKYSFWGNTVIEENSNILCIRNLFKVWSIEGNWGGGGSYKMVFTHKKVCARWITDLLMEGQKKQRVFCWKEL